MTSSSSLSMTNELPTLSSLMATVKTTIASQKEDLNDDERNETTTTTLPPIIGLYFAASWCDDCQASHPIVSKLFQQQLENGKSKEPSSKLLDLVYISSDNTVEQMTNNLKNEKGWNNIPFDMIELRTNLKQHFGICAKKEMETIGITEEQRKGGIPTLVLVNRNTDTILCHDAMPDLMGETKKENPFEYWKSL